MQAQAAVAAACLMQPRFPLPSPKTTSTLVSCPPRLTVLRRSSATGATIKAAPSVAYENDYDAQTYDYNSAFSVFPAEACETIGGEACAANIYPEAKVKQEAPSMRSTVASEEVDRDYFDYSDPKSVLRGEACDDLGGEFCQSPYQRGVY
ncbi:hypothetical protein Nepgr_008726 [Nepenthes gracilis]|uniref:Light-regulated protein n=1 Tax=Nepenthes gracilis TaxID=150966 RepID=A0AAD3XJQ7_NEPGR|nr:hypothetical protein Nepgr_008726 [Nepenthes gracilis]